MTRIDWIGVGIAVTGVAVSLALIVGCAWAFVAVAP